MLGETEVYFDRGDDYLAFSRLMEDCTIGIASVDGVPAAVSCGAKHTVRIGGVLRPLLTVSHLRVLPEHQRKGWGRALLTQVIDDYRGRGMERFYLGATEAGRPLYANLGFETIADLSAWVLGPSPQAPG